MFTLESAFACAIAMVLTMAVAAIFLTLGIRFSAMFLFLVLFVSTLTGGRLIAPVGPLLWEVPWLSLFLAGVAGSMIVTALALLARLFQPHREKKASLQPKCIPTFDSHRKERPVTPLLQGRWE